MQDYWWWYFTKGAACYRVMWGWTLGRHRKHWPYYVIDRINYILDKHNWDFEKDPMIMKDFILGRTYIYFKNPFVMRISNIREPSIFDKIPKVLNPEQIM